MSLFRLLLAAAVIASVSSAHAKPAAKSSPTSGLTAEFKAAGRLIPRKLLAMGYTHLGRVDLRDFISKMDQVDVQSATWLSTDRTQNGQPLARNAGRWDRKGNSAKIQYTTSLWKQTPADARPVFALHEYMGATGDFEDTNYTASVGMYYLAAPETAEILRATEINTLSNVVSQQALGGGSITGVGGGGEGIIIAGRLRYLHTLLGDVKTSSEADRADNVNDFLSSLFDHDEIGRGQYVHHD